MPSSFSSFSSSSADELTPVTVDRTVGRCGEMVLRRRGERYEIIANGCFLMDTSDGRSERLLVRAALDALAARVARVSRPTVLIGGLGVGFALAEAAGEPRWGRITVVEREPAVIGWHRAGHLAQFTEGAFADPRVQTVEADVIDHLTAADPGAYDAICLDIDNGPDWTVTDTNAGLYDADGLVLLRDRLSPHGVLAVWSAQPSATFEDRLRRIFAEVWTLEVPAADGTSTRQVDVVHLASPLIQRERIAGPQV